MRKLLPIVFYLIHTQAPAQSIDNTAAFREISSERYFRIHYENDFILNTDNYYTQGFSLELVHPAVKNFILSKALLYFKKSATSYGVALEHDVFTPSSLKENQIIFKDRPYAACLLFKTFSVSADRFSRQRLSAVMTVGLIGKAALGAEMQTEFHHLLNSELPMGWHHQIRNDVILNYELKHEKQLFAYGNYFLINSNLQVRAGTLKDNLHAGLTLMAGKFNPAFEWPLLESKDFKGYFYNQSLLIFNVYDATLQGGVFNHNSPYTLSSGELVRLVFQNNYGVIISIRKVYIEYAQSFLTKEFKHGFAHKWSGIKIGLLF